MNINDKGNIHECTSCQMCAAVCPKQAISIGMSTEGFYRPSVNIGKCVDCGLCKSVCYKYSEIETYNQYDALINYAASANDDDTVANTTSGGLGDVLCEHLICEGYLCVGVVYDTEKEIALNKIAYNREDTYGFRGSKYIQSYTYPAFLELVQKHLNDKVAVFGTPCHIFAIDKYLRKRNKRDNFILIDIYCHGCPSYHVWNKYIQYVKKKTGERFFDSVSFRSKAYGWGSYYVAQMKKGGRTLFTSPKINDKFYTLFFSDVLLNDSCYDCQLRSTMASTDIRIGDFWGKAYLKNSRGVSLVTINPVSARGIALFDSIKNKISYAKHSSDECISYQSWGKVHPMNEMLRKKLFESLTNQNTCIEDVVSLYWHNCSLIAKVKQSLKNLIFLMPRPVVAFVKGLL